jgi:hypothetical protein
MLAKGIATFMIAMISLERRAINLQHSLLS